jgi:hypothetical protein
MKSGFVENGYSYLLRGQKKMAMESIQKKYAQELATAGPIQKQQIQQKITAEFLRRQNHKPSPGTLW